MEHLRPAMVMAVPAVVITPPNRFYDFDDNPLRLPALGSASSRAHAQRTLLRVSSPGDVDKSRGALEKRQTHPTFEQSCVLDVLNSSQWHSPPSISVQDVCVRVLVL
jgi:hypothetical protein